MSTHGHIDFDKFVRRILLDIDLLQWFATHGGRHDAVLAAIAFIRATEDHPALTFLARHIGGADEHH